MNTNAEQVCKQLLNLLLRVKTIPCVAVRWTWFVCVWEGRIKYKEKTKRNSKEGIISNLLVRRERKYSMDGYQMCLLLVMRKMRCCPTLRNS